MLISIPLSCFSLYLLIKCQTAMDYWDTWTDNTCALSTRFLSRIQSHISILHSYQPTYFKSWLLYLLPNLVLMCPPSVHGVHTASSMPPGLSYVVGNADFYNWKTVRGISTVYIHLSSPYLKLEIMQNSRDSSSFMSCICEECLGAAEWGRGWAPNGHMGPLPAPYDNSPELCGV